MLNSRGIAMTESKNGDAAVAEIARVMGETFALLNAGAAALRTWLQSEAVAQAVSEMRETIARAQSWLSQNPDFFERVAYNHNLVMDQARRSPLRMLAPSLLSDSSEPEGSEPEGSGDPRRRDRLN